MNLVSTETTKCCYPGEHDFGWRRKKPCKTCGYTLHTLLLHAYNLLREDDVSGTSDQ